MQQKCRDLHIKIGGNKEEVVRRLTTHMIDQDYVQLATSGATFGSLGMSQYLGSEGYATGQPSSDEEDLAAEWQASRPTNGTSTG